MTANRMINATNAALDEAPEALNGVRVNVSNNVDLLAVVDPVVGVSASTQAVVGTEVIGKDNGLWENVFLDESIQGVGFNVGGDNCSNLSLSLNHTNDRSFVSSAPARSLGSASVVSLIHFDFAIKATNRAALIVVQHRANLLEHAPCSFVGDARLALNLLGRDSATGLCHQVDRIEPSRKWRGRLVEDRVSGRVNVMAAMIARVGRAAPNAVMLRDRVARFAKDAIRVQVVLEPFKAGRVIWKLLLEVFQREWQHVRLAIVVGHNLTYSQVKS